MAKKKDDVVVEVGRDAKNGQFIPVKAVERRHDTAIVQKIHRPRHPGSGGSKRK